MDYCGQRCLPSYFVGFFKKERLKATTKQTTNMFYNAKGERVFGMYSSTTVLCVNNIRNFGIVGQIAIHEWAHSCGWDHNDGGGVPGTNGYMSQ